jgi:ubiquinone/menaquinone biosynthesis C-methylase UbiE
MIFTETEIKRFYESSAVAERYVSERFTSELNRMLHLRQVAAVQRTIGRCQPATALEIATGPGRLTRDVRASGLLVCLEYNNAMVAEGRSAVRTPSAWVRGDAFHLPFSPPFDLVYSFRFIRHFRRADRERIYAEIRRVLRPGGCFLLDAVNARVSGPSRAKRPDLFPVYDKLYERSELFEELTGAGFLPVSARAVYKFKRCQHLSQVLVGPRANWLNRLLINFLEALPSRNGEEWIVECRRV